MMNKMMKKIISAALVALLTVAPALAQTSPNLRQGQVLTPGQWNALFASKQDALGFTPIGPSGGIFTGSIYVNSTLHISTNYSTNTFLGNSTGQDATTPNPPHDGDGLTYVGAGAGQRGTHTFAQTLVGTGAGANFTIGDSNSCFGYQTCLAGVDAKSNVGVGVDNLFSCVSCQDIVSVGHHSAGNVVFSAGFGQAVMIGAESVASGLGAVGMTVGGYRSAFNLGPSAIGSTFWGQLTGFSTTSGANNNYNGQESGWQGTTACNNAFYGFRTGFSNVTGCGGVYLGAFSGFYETAGNTLMIDNQSRIDQADARVKALIYGIFDALPANQLVRVNGNLTAVVTAKVGPGVASNAAPLLVNTLGGSAAGIQFLQDGFSSWIIQNTASSTTLSFAESGTPRMTLTSTGILSLSATTVSSGTTTGALVVAGGAGIGGALNVGGGITGSLAGSTGLPIGTGLTGAGTGVLAALAVNVGSAGAFVVNGGAGGTPSTITLTNGTGLPTTALIGTLQAAQEPAHTGDVTNSAGSLALMLATVNGNVGTFGSATQASQVTVNAKGLVTAASSVTVTPAFSNVTGQATLAQLPTIASNTVLGNLTAGLATPTAMSVGTCSTAGSALFWTLNVGFGCNTSITAAAVPVGGITGLGANVGTALAVAVGSAGAFVTNGGALGSPSSAGTFPAHAWGGIVSGGGNQLNNVIIGAATPLAGSFTTVSGSTSLTSPIHYGGSAAGSTLNLQSTSNGSPSGDSIALTTGGSARQTILSAGNIGMGTETNPVGKVVISSNTTTGITGVGSTTLLTLFGADANNALFGMYSYGTGVNPAILQRAARGTGASPSASQSGDTLGGYLAGGYAASTYDAAFNSGFLVIASENHTLTANGTYLSVLTTPNLSTTRTEAMRVQPSGGISIGTAADPGIGALILKKQTFASLTACSATIEGAMASVTDSSTATWGATITGSSTNHVLGYCDGTNWTVAGK